MPIIYCPNNDCASEVKYTGAKPTICPKCKKPFSSAFKDTSVAQIIVPPKAVAVAHPTVKPKKKRPASLASRFQDEDKEPIPMSPIEMDVPIEVQLIEDDTEDENYDGGEADPDAISATASQILASLDPNDVIVNNESEGWGVRIPRPPIQQP